MVIKILSSASSDFHGVKYNDKKVENGKGELMTMENFPSFINENSSQEEVKNYLKTISNQSGKTKKPQFHAVLSTKFQEHSKEELTDLAKDFMQEMGYGHQPYIVVFHNDTDNNHVHIVSTRVDKESGKKIDDSFEKLKSQKAVAKILERKYGEKPTPELQKLLSYKYGSISQLKTLLERNGYEIREDSNDNNIFNIYKAGEKQMELNGNQLTFSNAIDKKRKVQIKAILNKYSQLKSNNVFRVNDNRKNEGLYNKDAEKKNDIKIEFESELQHFLKTKFGLDIIFHHKDEKTPFGFTLIDNKSGKIYKGSELGKMNDFFEFTIEKLDKKIFEKLKEFNTRNAEEKRLVAKQFDKNGVKDWMIFGKSEKKDKETYSQIRSETLEFLKGKTNENIFLHRTDDGIMMIHTKFHHIQDLKSLVGDIAFERFMNPQAKENFERKSEPKTDIIGSLLRGSYTAHDSAEDELKKRRKKRRK